MTRDAGLRDLGLALRSFGPCLRTDTCAPPPGASSAMLGSKHAEGNVESRAGLVVRELKMHAGVSDTWEAAVTFQNVTVRI